MHRTQKYRAEAAKHAVTVDARPSVEKGLLPWRFRGFDFATRKNELTQEQLWELADNLAENVGDFA